LAKASGREIECPAAAGRESKGRSWSAGTAAAVEEGVAA
jgi:hypothetical protein